MLWLSATLGMCTYSYIYWGQVLDITNLMKTFGQYFVSTVILEDDEMTIIVAWFFKANFVGGAVMCKQHRLSRVCARFVLEFGYCVALIMNNFHKPYGLRPWWVSAVLLWSLLRNGQCCSELLWRKANTSNTNDCNIFNRVYWFIDIILDTEMKRFGQYKCNVTLANHVRPFMYKPVKGAMIARIKYIVRVHDISENMACFVMYSGRDLCPHPWYQKWIHRPQLRPLWGRRTLVATYLTFKGSLLRAMVLCKKSGLLCYDTLPVLGRFLSTAGRTYHWCKCWIDWDSLQRQCSGKKHWSCWCHDWWPGLWII
jgi:hypothetical protein